MSSDKEMLDWIDKTVANNQWHDGREERRAVKFYWGSQGGGFRIMECTERGADDTFPTVREALAAAMLEAGTPSDTPEDALPAP